MEDKELKKKLSKIPDADKHGDPIYKIDNEPDEEADEKPEDPIFIKDSPEAAQGNTQDVQDKSQE